MNYVVNPIESLCYEWTLTNLGLSTESCYIDANVAEIWERMTDEMIARMEETDRIILGMDLRFKQEPSRPTIYRGEFLIKEEKTRCAEETDSS